MQARLDNAALSSREREHSQQLGAKEVQVSALERELSTMEGQLVAAQAEAKTATQASQAAELTTVRERERLMQQHHDLEADKQQLQAQLATSERIREQLQEQVAQGGADRDFCYEMIRELKGQIAAAYAAPA